jgi:hypothetical protein
MDNELKLKAKAIADHLEANASSRGMITRTVVNVIPQAWPATVKVRGAGEVVFESFELYWATCKVLTARALRDKTVNKPRTKGQRSFARNLAKAGFA